MGLEESRVDELQVGEDAAVVVDLLLSGGKHKSRSHKSAHQESRASNVDILPVQAVQQGPNRTTADNAHGATEKGDFNENCRIAVSRR